MITMKMIEKKYDIVYDDDFKRDLRKLSIKDQKSILRKLRIFENNPFYSSLRTKKLHGYREERYESSINMDIRILWRFDGERIIVVLKVGHHDILKSRRL
jgi:mRNA interferase RelE/StbE